MTLHNGTYHYLSCNAQIDNLLFPTCRTVSASKLDDKTAAVEAALKLGWTEKAGGHRCPEHSEAAATVKPAPRVRAPKTSTAASDQDPWADPPKTD